MSTTVVHCKKATFDVYIGRPGPWGNPYEIGRDGTREQVLRKYTTWLIGQPALMEKAKTELQYKTLGCWCKPLPCHGDILAKLVNDGVI